EVVVDREVLPSSQAARIPAGARDTEIHYTGLSFLNPSQTLFRYRLLGHDPDWVDAGTRRVAYYGALPPDRYVFRVAASNDGLAWTTKEGALEIVVTPLWYQRWIVRLFGFAAAASLIAGAFAWRVRRLRQRERALAALVASRTEELAVRTRELEAANVSLSQLAITDDLTGIANVRQFREFISREWLRCARTHEPISLLMCDIDEFKAYNDALGHQKGDECLRAVAQELAATVKRAPDLAARYGGEEFVVVLPATDPDGAVAVAEAIRKALRERGLPHPRSRVGAAVTMSMGISTAVPGPETSVETLLAAADRALYAAKSAGRDRYMVA
ncbi:MAG TPA: diguanylate cyclase, partial [Vicinamibacteria bacterium]|nr:diguanylate cyclase [Vicinamibacteria bacterium]